MGHAWGRRGFIGVWWGNMKKETTLKTQDQLEGQYGNGSYEELAWEGVDCINLAQESGQCCAVVDMVMNVWLP